MTNDEIECKLEELREKREKLVAQLLEPDAAAGSVSMGGGSRSYTARSVADIKAKIAFCDKEIKELQALLGQALRPGTIRAVYPRYYA